MSQVLPGAEHPLLTVGVLADTHVPDRVNALHPRLLDTFRSAGVQQILHAGDICSPVVLDNLRQVAPVCAVRGNRDWLLYRLPLAQMVDLGGVQVALMHGHGDFARYLRDKVHYFLEGYRLKRYLKVLTKTMPAAQVVVYGHTHRPELLWYQGKLLFNPGSACFGFHRSRPPSVGLLHIFADGRVSAEFKMLEGWRVEQGVWRQAPIYSPI